MSSLLARITQSPLAVRAVPFGLFVLLTAGQGVFGEASRYWMYGAKTVVGAWMIWVIRPFVAEMRWTLSWEAVVVGVAVWGMWIGLDGYYPRFMAPDTPWNPHAAFGAGTAAAWGLVAVRWLGSTLVVPPLEELFFRSLVYRYLAKADFLSVPLGRWLPVPFLAGSILFGGYHYEWLAGILCGFAYQGLVVWKGRLGDAITAHAITNGLLGLWVVGKGEWHFW
ncbi:MAG: CAAX prenyl protease-related protein [Verrucomicrobia bacterium]|nr:CAAX prenyl protease-related protein [Verrucomicrobiota bacterium]